MKDKDKISEVYRKQVEKFIGNQSENCLLPQLTLHEENEIWEEISDEMDIDEVWSNISYELDTDMPGIHGSGVILKSVAIFIVLLMGLVPAKKVIPDSVIAKQDIFAENLNNKLPEVDPATDMGMDYDTVETPEEHLMMPVKNNLQQSNITGQILPAKTIISGPVESKTIIGMGEQVSYNQTDYEKDTSYLTIQVTENVLEKNEIPPVLIPFEIKDLEFIPREVPGNLKTDNHYLTSSGYPSLINDGKGFSFGLITSFRNTWLLNQETLDGLKSESLNATEIVFFPDAGLTMTYSLNNKWKLQADGFISSSAGQEYFDYIYGHYSKKKVTLKYSTINLSVKHKLDMSGNLMQHSSVNVAGGFYFSFLHYVYQKINNDLEDIGSQFRKFDYGITCGAEFEVYIFDRVSVSPGVKLSLGLPNIYKGDDLIPGYLRKTQNGSAELCLAIFYHYH